MGTWNTKPFGNDTAGDWLWELEKAKDDSVIKAALETDADEDEAVAAAAVVEAARRQPVGKLPPNAKQWVSESGFVPSDALVQQAIAAVERIKTQSELRELWAESGSLQTWLKQMELLLSGLREVQSLPPPMRLPKAPATPRKLEKIIEKINPEEESLLRKTLRKKLEAITDLEASVTGTVLASSPLTLLAKQGLLPEAKRLVERGAKINPERKGEFTYTPLGEACRSGHAEMVKWLLEQGAATYVERKVEVPVGGLKFESKTFSIPSAFHAAIKSGSIATIEVLVEHDARLKIEDLAIEYSKVWHETPLHKAVDANHPHVIEFLVRSGLNLEARNSLEMTALGWAALQAGHNDRKKVVEMLLSLGADPNAKDNEGLTPLDLVADTNHDVAELVKKHGGRFAKDIRG